MAYQNLISEIKENILYVTINRERALNALNKETLAELADVIAYAGKTEQIRGVILTGAGDKAFVAGADIKEFSDYSGKQGEDLAKLGHDQVFNAIENSPKPFIAAINGFALGGGLELAMACHMRIASDHAKLGLPEVTLGLIPGYGGTQRLTQLVGKGKAIEMITTANMITASVAEKIGLVNYVVSQADLISKAEEILNAIKQRAPLAVSAAIKAVVAAVNNNNGYATEIEEFGKCFETADFKEGVTAFVEKRKANFSGK
ncbi:enoyl-CoA hydratase/isomerase family protein [Pedobacter sp. MR2016-19]|uniref:enoyl-CoA hydratase/isomerase family protein n=1 Tax=Pedobacter sp. MR2016-19 TaxID=2780089 RepID=UPI0018761B8B|nr:enoyl-CoA hydratase-related protein [Pedobacter sp. MR2016-19]MBE5317660.1 enoyl-CoA hydratase/isomerase family protein [Pedobacter sp. MR2016-19]